MHGHLTPQQNSEQFQKPRDQSRSPIIKRSIVIGGHKTSISLEDAFWSDLRDIARESHVTLSSLLASIDKARGSEGNLSSAARVFVLETWHKRQKTNISTQGAN